MATRLPAKSLEGKRIRILISPNAKEGATGKVTAVDTFNGDVTVALEAGASAGSRPITINVNWGNGDRWMCVPADAHTVV